MILPTNRCDFEDAETRGLWKAIALSKTIGSSDRVLDTTVILEIHRAILVEAMPSAAGRFRVAGEDVKKLTCIEPLPGSAVAEKMHLFEKDLVHRASLVARRPDRKTGKGYRHWLNEVFELAAWVQHSLVAIHPFCEGNGRLARLMTNVILRRHGLPPSTVKVEAQDKPKYIAALCRIDEQFDYRPLKGLILRGSIATQREELKRRVARAKRRSSR